MNVFYASGQQGRNDDCFSFCGGDISASRITSDISFLMVWSLTVRSFRDMPRFHELPFLLSPPITALLYKRLPFSLLVEGMLNTDQQSDKKSSVNKQNQRIEILVN